MRVSPVADVSLVWGESLRWDDRRQRLYFVDCATNTLHWLDGGEPPLRSFVLPSLPTGVVLTEDERLVIALDDGLHVVDPDAATTELVAPYPAELGGRANDATADLHGNVVTGTLNLGPAPGSCWWWSSTEGWRQLDDGISNTNGPVVLDTPDGHLLVVADTPAGVVLAYDYDGQTGTATNRRTFADIAAAGGRPDGACADATGAVWCCALGTGSVLRFTAAGPDGSVDVGAELPSDVTFGGPALDQMYVVSIALPLAGVEIESPHAGRLLRVDGLDVSGRPEPRASL